LLAVVVMLSAFVHRMQKLLLGVCQPFAIQGDAAGELYELRPEIFLTVLAEGTSDELGKGSVASLRVLAQGIHLTPGTVQRALGLLYAQLTRYELELSKATEKRVGSGAQPNNPDYNTQSALQACMFALDLLPKDAVPLIVLFSDGCSSLNDYTGAYDKSLLRELHQQDVACITVAMGATDPCTCPLFYSAASNPPIFIFKLPCSEGSPTSNSCAFWHWQRVAYLLTVTISRTTRPGASSCATRMSWRIFPRWHRTCLPTLSLPFDGPRRCRA